MVTPFLSEAHQSHYHRSYALHNHSAVLRKICKFKVDDINLTCRSHKATNMCFGLMTMLFTSTLPPQPQAQEKWQF